MQIAAEIDAVPLVLEILVGIAALLTEDGEGGRALECVRFVCSHPAGTGQTRDRAMRLRTQVEQQLSPEEIAEVRWGGKPSPLAGVVNKVLAAL